MKKGIVSAYGKEARMKFLITNKSLPDNPRLQDFDELVPLRHFWRSVTITLFVVVLIVILLKLIVHYTLQVDPEYVLPYSKGSLNIRHAGRNHEVSDNTR
jgi:hypothetical protein